MKLLSLIYSYYESPQMFLRHVEEWEKYPDWVKEQLMICITDDCSEKSPLSNVVRFPEGIEGRAFKLVRKVPNNGYSCLNLGVNFAASQWIVISDIDHLLTCGSVISLVEKLDKLDKRKVYRFQRFGVSENKLILPHGLSFLMTRDMYWMIGGHDEDLVGIYYGGPSRSFLHRVKRIAKEIEVLDVLLTRYTNNEIPDASYIGFPRDESNDRMKVKLIKEKKAEEGRTGQTKILSFPYIELNVDRCKDTV